MSVAIEPREYSVGPYVLRIGSNMPPFLSGRLCVENESHNQPEANQPSA